MRTIRKRRVIVIDDEPSILELFTDLFTPRGYEVITHTEPVGCTVYADSKTACNFAYPCSDIMITDDLMPRMNGLEMLRIQQRNGCKMDTRNKALMSGDIDDGKQKELDTLGCRYFPKPFALRSMESWIAECERRMDLTKPLATRRKCERYPAHYDVSFSSDHTSALHLGTAVNISSDGLCIKVPAPLLREQRVRIQTDLPITCQTASVRWICSLNDGAYLAGLACC
jgi:DNA-binding response OmpR family regulator